MTNKRKTYIRPSFETMETELEESLMVLTSGPGVDDSENPGDSDIDNSDKSQKKKRERSIWDAQSGDMWG